MLNLHKRYVTKNAHLIDVDAANYKASCSILRGSHNKRLNPVISDTLEEYLSMCHAMGRPYSIDPVVSATSTILHLNLSSARRMILVSKTMVYTGVRLIEDSALNLNVFRATSYLSEG